MVTAPVHDLVTSALNGERKAVAKLISMVEDGSTELPAIMQGLFAHTGDAHTVGITGSPGAGKSTLTESLVTKIRQDGHRVGVLAVDPSSPFTGGALLGDRVRMQTHATDPDVFIRSMATRGHLGGLALATPEAVRVLDAAGFDQIVIETVGVGQAEVDIVEQADTTVVVVNPGWGDSVQAGKAGLMEIGDVFAINKADRDGAKQVMRDLTQMLDLGPPREWRPPIIETVATEGRGVDALWAAIGSHARHLRDSGELQRRRRSRVVKEISDIVAARVRARVASDMSGQLQASVDEVMDRKTDPYSAAQRLLDRLESA